MSNIASDIFEDIVDRLGEITIANGYENDLDIFEEVQQPASPNDRDVVVLAGDTVQQTNPPLGFDEFHLPIGVVCYAIQSERSDVPIRERLQSMAADVRKALGVALLQEDRQFINILWPENDDYYVEGSPPSVLLKPHFQYRTLRNNPNSQ